jgi:pimeloyl-ACP methyl ester carboxylesterase
VAELDTNHLDRLVLIGSGRGAPKNAENDALLQAFAALKDPISYTFARDFQASTIYHQVPAIFFETLVAEAQRVPTATWHGLAQTVSAEESVQDLKKIRAPTLVFWGEKDGIFKRTDQDRLIEAIPHATLKPYAETGHALHWERPEEFTKDLLEFIQTQGD